MSTSGVLDSSPVPIPPARPSLKRSASVASLPTPPRTTHKKRGRSKASTVFESSEDEKKGDVSDDDEEEGGILLDRHKKRRTLDSIAAVLSGVEEGDEDDEDAFWMGTSPAKKRTQAQARDRRGKAGSSRLRGKSTSEKQERVVAPVSPPPSRRQVRATTPPPPPVTPPRRPRAGPSRTTKKVLPMPVRDSPNNPFLDDSPASVPASSPEPHTPTPTQYEEKERITYVFRGVKTTFRNPHYKATSSARTLLSPSHPDFSPSEACPPKILFPTARKSKTKAQTASSVASRRSPTADDSTADEDEDAGIAFPRERLFRDELGELKEKEMAGVSVLNGEKDEPGRRALGPPRTTKTDS
ncbi:hypothetical protein JAAARDRAFT_68001 [Jaapia argillacea MUCL 33604]|uniref:Uncharacterized protein n=1 Tax=Jaapia argillacea MUCL 33604 TaxID=933084 RepID=A0A067QAE5_9AGAM|nr:hypothetical protein JAAARDRAFT_68001 [Jaapia argillacea MUCL 33604]